MGRGKEMGEKLRKLEVENAEQGSKLAKLEARVSKDSAYLMTCAQSCKMSIFYTEQIFQIKFYPNFTQIYLPYL